MLVRPLTPTDVKRHHALICEYGNIRFGKNPLSISPIGCGEQKGVYKVDYGDNAFVASAATRDPKRQLLEEYNILTELYAGAPAFFPRPMAHFSGGDGLGELLTMEFLPHQDLDKVEHKNVTDYFRKLARKIGEAVAVTNIRTGRYSSEPHNGNILGLVNDEDVSVKFCDAIQFKKGNLYSAVEAILIDVNMRPECFRFVNRFREGLVDGIVANEHITREDANSRLDFIKRFNDIF